LPNKIKPCIPDHYMPVIDFNNHFYKLIHPVSGLLTYAKFYQHIRSYYESKNNNTQVDHKLIGNCSDWYLSRGGLKAVSIRMDPDSVKYTRLSGSRTACSFLPVSFQPSVNGFSEMATIRIRPTIYKPPINTIGARAQKRPRLRYNHSPALQSIT